jgi:hypothetical protein
MYLAHARGCELWALSWFYRPAAGVRGGTGVTATKELWVWP